MWLFTKYGFYSAVCCRQGDGEHHQPVDPHRVMVRARVRGHLETLQERFPDALGACEIQQYPGADYAYRLFAPKSTWAQVVASLAEETDYDNFKTAVGRRPGQESSAYAQALAEVWGVMNRLQK